MAGATAADGGGDRGRGGRRLLNPPPIETLFSKVTTTLPLHAKTSQYESLSCASRRPKAAMTSH